ncbi:hypothetical protein ACFYKT_04905 [Cytobacillus sp. FJAT-53684]|uniref:Uncharacterized protein n=1 Tax=Cytobacillus mangrovibacter TaxID=3299024 RepID=A0ABW6JY60_9BACI
MNEKLIAKEELLNMLTEISDQLEDLENILEKNLSKVRQAVQNDHSEKMVNCEERITALEKQTSMDLEADEAIGIKSQSNRPKTMKLELGF